MNDTITKYDADDPRWTAFALGELEGDEARAFEARVALDDEARAAVAEIRELSALLGEGLASEPGGELTDAQREEVVGREPVAAVPVQRKRRWVLPASLGALATAAAGLTFVVIYQEKLAPAESIAPFTYGFEGPASSPPNRFADLGYVDSAPVARKRESEVRLQTLGYGGGMGYGSFESEAPEHNTEGYDHTPENDFVLVADDPRSTFSIDVDTASYSNVRRYLFKEGALPPADAVRIEELVNYFPYDYPEPAAGEPFSVDVEVAAAPWKPAHRLVKIGLKGRSVNYAERENANLVFLLDVSGSMNNAFKLPLLVDAMSMLVENLDPSDRVAIVVYAGSSGLVLDSTSCEQKPRILEALERLKAGGSTNGGAGIELAYRVATENFVEGGVNRVILATDGDFNVGTTSQGNLVRLIQEKARTGVFLTVLGFGTGNLKDSTMEQLADEGNGNYAYIDTALEARKVLVEQLGGTLVTIAKDVKIQVEFNPAEVNAWRLVGYENRVLEHRDFNDDKKDAGEIGSGHTVTALYEVVPAGVELETPGTDPLRYQESSQSTAAAGSGELLNLKLRYKTPAGSKSTLREFPVRDGGADMGDATEDFRFAAAVASFGMLLRDSDHKGDATWEETLRLAQEGLGADVGGYRQEFLQLVLRAQSLAGR